MDTFSPPKGVQDAAKRALQWLADGQAGSGFTDVGRKRASQLANGQAVSLETVKRMNSYFARHEVDKQAEGFTQGEKGFPSPGRVAWDAWGGDAGKSWASNIVSNAKDKAMELGYGYAEITKADEQPDGTMIVYGKASDDTIDSDAQIVDNNWMKSAMPEWMSAGGNIREQHSSIAAGVAKELEEKADGWYVRAHVVDPASVLKVKHGVLKGFSIGIRGARVVRDEKALGGRIVGGTIVEVSLVDRPANPNAKLMLAKADELGKLTAVSIEVPKPSDLFKSDAPADEVAPISETPELVEESEVAPTPAEAPAEETPAEEVAPEAEIVEAAKALLATVNKFDQAAYDSAIGAISDLIVVEAGEMADGSDERDSIKNLLRASKHLYRWYQGEVANGEVANPNPAIAGGDDDDVDSDSDADAVEAIYAGKSLALDSEQIDGVLVKAIEAAKAAVSSEIDSLKSALEAETAKSMELKAELDSALTKAASGGPARTSLTASNSNSDLLAKAADYRAKASNPAITDKTLIKGWLEIAEGLEAKAKKGTK